jgi:hypothetical protein
MLRPTLIVTALLIPATFAQINLRDNRDPELACGKLNYCEMREETVAATSQFSIEGLHNGSVTVRGSNRTDVRVRLRVESGALSEAAAKDMFSRVHTHVSPGRITVDGPDKESFWGWTKGDWWSVSAEVFVPYNTDLRLESHNGAITVSDIRGRVETKAHNGAIKVERVTGAARISSHNGAINIADLGSDLALEAHNGAITATRVAGSVTGVNHNGGISVDLTGASSPSRRVDIESHNGRIRVGLPRAFSARVHSESHHGGLNSDFPVTVRGRIQTDGDSNRDFDIGSGEASIRVRTHNGGVRLEQL